MKLLLYCTKAKPVLYKPFEWDCFPNDEASRFYLGDSKTIEIDEELNGKIVAECDFEVSNIESYQSFYNYGFVYYTTRKEPFRYFSYTDLLEASCLQDNECCKYLGSNNGYAIHIKNLHIFDEPKELNNYITKQCQFGKCSTCEYGKKEVHCGTIDTPITKAPQNMMYCYEDGEMKVLISIRPEWLCKILNGEKTIEVRKKVLKEMLNDTK